MTEFITSLQERAQTLRQVADELEQRADFLAAIMQAEMGKIKPEGVAEIEKCAWVCRYYADHGAEFLAGDSRVCYQALGAILAIMPWNYPFWQLFRVAAPAMMAGNTIVLKHSELVPRCALEIEKLFPSHFLKSVQISHDEVEKLIASSQIQAVTLTGSVRAGRAVAQIAAKYLKPCVLELGGSDPFIVFADADIKRAALIAAQSRCLNSGQSCIAAKRFLVESAVFDEFVSCLADAMKLQMTAALASESQQRELDDQIADALAQGARLVGDRVLININTSMRVWNEETFGVIAPVMPFENDDKAIKLANDTEYGLGASVWTHDESRISRFVGDLQCGMVFVNEMVKSDPRVPFGGIKHSGFGRELAREGILSFVNVKTVWWD